MNPEGVASYIKCDVKHISQRNLKIFLVFNLKRPVREAYVHTVTYYKYNTYQKYPIDLREDICGWLNGKSKSYLLDWTVKRVMNYTNLHPCPLDGEISIKVNNISLDKFPFEPLLPSGRYRLDINVTEGNENNVIFMIKIFLSVSDHRIEQY